MIVNYLYYMIMADVDKINDFIQSHLKSNGLCKITTVEMASHLEKNGLLNDSKDRPGKPLRKLCRDKKIHSASQPDGWHWIIEYDQDYKSSSNYSLSATVRQNRAECTKEENSIMNSAHCESLAAYVPEDPRILVLGTMPGQQSLRLHQYYANPANRFWKIIAEAAGKPLPIVYSDRLKLLDQLHVALWDVYASAERKGSLDSKIANKKRNDIQSLVKANPSINKILFNGNKAYEESLDYGCVNVAMPSTSPANTHLTQEELFSKWLKEIKEY